MNSGPFKWANARIVRYADDFVVMAKYQGDELRSFVETKIESWLGLKLNQDKTEVVNLSNVGESFDFLGFTFRYDKDLYGKDKRYLNVTPSKKALKTEREKLRSMISKKQSHVPLPQLIAKVNKQLNGWAGYFSFGYPRVAHRSMNQYVRVRLTRHLRRRSQRGCRPPKGRSYYQHFKSMGLVYL